MQFAKPRHGVAILPDVLSGAPLFPRPSIQDGRQVFPFGLSCGVLGCQFRVGFAVVTFPQDG